MFRVSVLGPLGTYTHEAAYKLFGADAVYDERDTIQGVFDSLSSVECGLVPQENSIFGNVVETYDCLRDIGFVRSEVTLQVQHCLLVKPGVKLCDIEKIISHEQALGQCRNFIKANLPAASIEKSSSTAAAAKLLLDSPPNCAAICSRVCATLFGLSILAEGIQNEAANFTRFYLVTRDNNVIIPELVTERNIGRALISITMDTPILSTSRATTISQLLGVLKLGVSRIDRRPAHRGTFSNVYFVEVQADVVKDERSWGLDASEALQRLKESGGDARLTGLW